MPKVTNTETVRNAIPTILNMWENNPDIALPELDLAAYKELAAQFQGYENQIRSLENQRYSLRVSLETLTAQLNALHTRLRSYTRAFFGPNSAQMNQIGLVRSVERKSPSRKVAGESSSTPQNQ